MKNLIFIFLIIFSITKVNAQVFTRHLAEEQKLEDFISFPIEKEIPYYGQPEINFERVLEEDRRNGNILHRVAVKVDQNYTVEDGLWSQYGDIMVWQIGFRAPKARSLNFLMKDLELPEGSEMYVLSKAGNIIHGPVTPDVIYDKVYSTDIIESNEVIILVKSDALQSKEFKIVINAVCQGVPRNSSLRAWQDASDCNFDVNCAIGNGWQNERDAVAFVLRNGQDHCSGALINNQCQDMRPFFLTAFHCLDSDLNGQLSAGEQNLGIYTFRFRYEAGTPTCPGNSTGNQGVWITFSGAMFRAANAATDFALIELNGTIINQPNIALAGWNRANLAPTSTTIIHHPAGDAKKITFDNDPAIQAVHLGVNCWFIQTDLGATEGGSSGSPYFDQIRRIIGQHLGINQEFLPICERTNRFGGRFNLSWTGGGTNATRLSNWLGAANPPMNMNTIRSPWISPWVPNNTQEYICTTNKVFTLNNPIPGRTITWSVSNPELFATTGGAATSGTTATATLRALSAGASGSATLTFTLTENGCNPVTVTRQIWVDRSGLPITTPPGTTPIEIGISQYHTVYLSSAPGSPNFIADWNTTGAVSRIGGNFPATYAPHVGNYIGTGNWQVTTSNVCGTRANFGQYNVTANCNPCPRIIINNPVQDILHAEIPNYVISENIINGKKPIQGDFLILDQNGNSLKSQKFNGRYHSVNVTTLKSGLYFIKMRSEGMDLTEKVVIIK